MAETGVEEWVRLSSRQREVRDWGSRQHLHAHTRIQYRYNNTALLSEGMSRGTAIR